MDLLFNHKEVRLTSDKWDNNIFEYHCPKWNKLFCCFEETKYNICPYCGMNLYKD